MLIKRGVEVEMDLSSQAGEGGGGTRSVHDGGSDVFRYSVFCSVPCMESAGSTNCEWVYK